MLLLAEAVNSTEALACGFLTEIVESDTLDRRAVALASKLRGHAPITMRASKEALRRLRMNRLSDDSDLIAAVYGSRDFAEGVAAFGDKRRPEWKGH
jgi:enoyl-CoA hydratase/carnithine racemase